MATIFGTDDTRLADADIRVGDDGLTLVAVRVSRTNRLLQYYFVRGERRVWTDLGGARLEGRLATRWQGGKRFWLIRLAAPIEPPAVVESVLVASSQSESEARGAGRSSIVASFANLPSFA